MKLENSRGDFWLPASVTLTKGTFRLSFVATRGSGPSSDIAIDDVTITAGACLTPCMYMLQIALNLTQLV